MWVCKLKKIKYCIGYPFEPQISIHTCALLFSAKAVNFCRDSSSFLYLIVFNHLYIWFCRELHSIFVWCYTTITSDHNRQISVLPASLGLELFEVLPILDWCYVSGRVYLSDHIYCPILTFTDNCVFSRNFTDQDCYLFNVIAKRSVLIVQWSYSWNLFALSVWHYCAVEIFKLSMHGNYHCFYIDKNGPLLIMYLIKLSKFYYLQVCDSVFSRYL